MDREASEMNLLSGSFEQQVIYWASMCPNPVLGAEATNPALR